MVTLMEAILQQKIEALEQSGVSNELSEKIGDYIGHETPPHLFRIPTFCLADQWELPRFEVLDAFLMATRHGIFDLVWDVHCPACKGMVQSTPRL